MHIRPRKIKQTIRSLSITRNLPEDIAWVFTSSEIVGGDESKLQVLSSGEVEDKLKGIQSAGSFTDLCGHFLAESSDITVESQKVSLRLYLLQQ